MAPPKRAAAAAKHRSPSSRKRPLDENDLSKSSTAKHAVPKRRKQVPARSQREEIPEAVIPNDGDEDVIAPMPDDIWESNFLRQQAKDMGLVPRETDLHHCFNYTSDWKVLSDAKTIGSRVQSFSSCTGGSPWEMCLDWLVGLKLHRKGYTVRRTAVAWKHSHTEQRFSDNDHVRGGSLWSDGVKKLEECHRLGFQQLAINVVMHADPLPNTTTVAPDHRLDPSGPTTISTSTNRNPRDDYGATHVGTQAYSQTNIDGNMCASIITNNHWMQGADSWEKPTPKVEYPRHTLVATPENPERRSLDFLIWLGEEPAFKDRLENDARNLIGVLVCKMDLSVAQMYDLPFKAWLDAGLKYGQYERMRKCLARWLHLNNLWDRLHEL